VPDRLAAEARAHGVSVEVYVQKILARQMLGTTGEERLESVRSAIDRILELRKGNILAGSESRTSSTKATNTDGDFRCGRLSGVGLVCRARI